MIDIFDGYPPDGMKPNLCEWCEEEIDGDGDDTLHDICREWLYDSNKKMLEE